MKIKTRLTKGWSTHQTMLIKTVMKCEGDVLELGAGLFSTPLLHWMCKMLGKKLVTYENDPQFYKLAKTFTSSRHKIILTEDWSDAPANKLWGVVFIDHHPEKQRAIDAIRFKDIAEYIVMHDTEKGHKYDYELVYPHFKCIYQWTECKPHTAVVSNLKDLSWLV